MPFGLIDGLLRHRSSGQRFLINARGHVSSPPSAAFAGLDLRLGADLKFLVNMSLMKKTRDEYSAANPHESDKTVKKRYLGRRFALRRYPARVSLPDETLHRRGLGLPLQLRRSQQKTVVLAIKSARSNDLSPDVNVGHRVEHPARPGANQIVKISHAALAGPYKWPPSYHSPAGGGTPN